MAEYRQRLEQFLRNQYYMISVIVIAIMGFGFSITHTSIDIDGLEGVHYYGEGHDTLASGRFGMSFWMKLTGGGLGGPYRAFAIDFISMLLLIAAAIQFCILLQRASENRFSMGGCILFSCMFISYPLINEIWEYTGINLCVCGGYLLVGLAVYWMYEFLYSQKISRRERIVYIAFSLFCTTIICSAYESLAAVYVLTVFTILLLRTLYMPKEQTSWKQMIREGLIYAAVLLGGVVLRLAAHQVILRLYHLTASLNGQTQILWGTKPVKEILENLFFGVHGILYLLVDQAIWYFPITVMLISLIVFGCGILFCSIKYKNSRIFLLGLGMILSLILLSFIQGNPSPNRACQTYALFISVTLLLIYSWIQKKKIIGKLFAAGIFILCIYQASFLNHIAALNFARSEYESEVIKTIGLDLSRTGEERPVVFVGECPIPDSIMDSVVLYEDDLRLYNRYRTIIGKSQYDHRKIVDSNVNSVLNWAMYAYNGDGSAVQRLFALYGFKINMMNRNNPETYEARQFIEENEVPVYPQNGYIVDRGDYVIVHLK